MWDLNVYLRCENDHPNLVAIRDRDAAVGSPCTECGAPLKPQPPRELRRRPPGGPPGRFN